MNTGRDRRRSSQRRRQPGPAERDGPALDHPAQRLGLGGRRERTDVYARLGVEPNDRQFVSKVLDKDHPEDENAIVWLDYDFDPATGVNPEAISLLLGLVGTGSPPGTTVRLDGGNDGQLPLAPPTSSAWPPTRTTPRQGDRPVRAGRDRRHRHRGAARRRRRSTTRTSGRHRERAHRALRVPPVPVRDRRRPAGILDQRHPRLPGQLRLELRGPLPPVDRDPRPDPAARARGAAAKLLLPPSGFVAGIYARSDIARGVFKAPANEVVQGLDQFEANINKGRDDVLNPEGINALRFFEGRGNRVWGARTHQLRPRVDVRQRAAPVHLPRALHRQGHPVGGLRAEQRAAVAERSPQSVEDFLQVQWLSGALLGATAGPGVLRPLRPHHDDAERPRQRPADLPDRRRARPSRPSSSSSASASGRPMPRRPSPPAATASS